MESFPTSYIKCAVLISFQRQLLTLQKSFRSGNIGSKFVTANQLIEMAIRLPLHELELLGQKHNCQRDHAAESSSTSDGIVRIYFTRGVTSVKIGSAISPCDRLKTLQIGNESKLHLERVIWADEGRQLEIRLHSLLIEHKQLGEWFALSSLDVELITEALTRNQIFKVNKSVEAENSNLKTDEKVKTESEKTRTDSDENQSGVRNIAVGEKNTNGKQSTGTTEISNEIQFATSDSIVAFPESLPINLTTPPRHRLAPMRFCVKLLEKYCSEDDEDARRHIVVHSKFVDWPPGDNGKLHKFRVDEKTTFSSRDVWFHDKCSNKCDLIKAVEVHVEGEDGTRTCDVGDFLVCDGKFATTQEAQQFGDALKRQEDILFQSCVRWDPRTCPYQINDFRFRHARIKGLSVCECGFPPAIKIVKKYTSPNRGRHFRTCAFERCKFFDWVEGSSAERNQVVQKMRRGRQLTKSDLKTIAKQRLFRFAPY